MKKINLAISGSLGRMGQQLIKSSKSNRSFKLVTLTENELFNKKTMLKKESTFLKNERVNKLDLANFLDYLINDLNLRGFFKPVEKKKSMIDNIYSIYNKIDLSKKELRMLWGMHKKLKNQPNL